MEDQKAQDRIRRRAYELWEQQGSPEGRAEELWELAKASLGEDPSDDRAGERPAEPGAEQEVQDGP